MVAEVGQRAATRAASDWARMRALAVMPKVGVALDGEADLADPDAARQTSLRDLTGCMGSPGEIAGRRRAPHQARDRRAAPPGRGPHRRAATAAISLVEEMLVRDDVDEETGASSAACAPRFASGRTRAASDPAGPPP